MPATSILVVVDLLAEIWRRAWAEQPVPGPAVVVGTAALALVAVCWAPLWRLTRHLVTVSHEGAHALVATLSGRRLSGIRLHSDTSGVTVSSGRASGPGMVATLVAGYLGPAAGGLAAAGLLASGHALGLLWLLLVWLAGMLLLIRNAYGLLVLLVCGAALGAVSWYLPAGGQTGVAYLITWLLLLAAPKPVLELARQRRRGWAPASDADQLARLTRVPGAVWVGFFLLANSAGLAVGVALLVPAVGELVRNLR